MPVKGMDIPILDRIKGKYTVTIETGCWEWSGSLSGQGQYPTIGQSGTKVPEYVYRVLWQEQNGPIPQGPCPDGSSRWELHHDCLNNRCVSWAHVRLVTKMEHQLIHKVIRAKVREARRLGYAPWVASLLVGGFAPERIKEVTGLPLHAIRAVAQAMRLPVQPCVALVAGVAEVA